MSAGKVVRECECLLLLRTKEDVRKKKKKRTDRCQAQTHRCLCNRIGRGAMRDCRAEYHDCVCSTVVCTTRIMSTELCRAAPGKHKCVCYRTDLICLALDSKHACTCNYVCSWRGVVSGVVKRAKPCLAPAEKHPCICKQVTDFSSGVCLAAAQHKCVCLNDSAQCQADAHTCICVSKGAPVCRRSELAHLCAQGAECLAKSGHASSCPHA